MSSFPESDGINFSALADPSIPTLQLMFGIDRFIDRMVDQMEHIKAGAKANFAATAPQPLADYLEYDTVGNVVFVGLTDLESQQYSSMGKFVEDGGKFTNDSDKHQFYSKFVRLDRKHTLPKAHKYINKASGDKENDYALRWVKGKDGGFVLVGLTQGENDEYHDYLVKSCASNMSDHSSPWKTMEERQITMDRYLELHNKHETARQERVSEEAKKRLSGYAP